MPTTLARALPCAALLSLAACKLELNAVPSTFVYPSALCTPAPTVFFWPADAEAEQFRYVLELGDQPIEYDHEEGTVALPLGEPFVGEDAATFGAAIVLLPQAEIEALRPRAGLLLAELVAAHPAIGTSIVAVDSEALGAELVELDGVVPIVEAMRAAAQAHRGALPKSLGDKMGENFWQPRWFVVPLDGPARDGEGVSQPLEYALLHGSSPAEGGRADALVSFDALLDVLPRPADGSQVPPMRFWVLTPSSYGDQARERAKRVLDWSATIDDPILYRVLSEITLELPEDASLEQIAEALWKLGDPAPALQGTQQYHISFQMPVAGIPPGSVRVPR